MFIGLRGTARATESHILLTEKNFQARRRLQRDSGRAWRQAIHGYTTGPAHGRCYITTREGEGSRVSRVFVDFGRGRVYALPEDGEEVMIFGDFLDV